MSADLLEAFGIPEVSQPHQTTSQDSLKVNSAQTQLRQAAALTNRPTSQFKESTYKEHFDKPLWERDIDGGEFLFDANLDDINDNEDDFGEFEDPDLDPGEPDSVPSKPGHAEIDLLGLDELAISERPSQDTKVAHGAGGVSQSSKGLVDTGLINATNANFTHKTEPEINVDFDDDWGTFEDADIQAPTAPSDYVTHTAVANLGNEQIQNEDEEWDAFEDGPPPQEDNTRSLPTIKATPTPTPPPPPSQMIQTTSPNNNSKPHPRPTNIPPPFTLLQLLPTIYQHLTNQSKQSRQDPKTIQTLAHTILQTYTVTARIISGRTHRWTRDTHLSQSMRISTANTPKTGMKLTTLDRTESIKENQQAIEVVNAWSLHNHILTSIMARAKIISKQQQQPPTKSQLSHNMKVRIVNGPGIITAKECCAICGLKRNERVVGVDHHDDHNYNDNNGGGENVVVEDVFGEFWIDFWGHRDCYDFWYRFNGFLERR